MSIKVIKTFTNKEDMIESRIAEIGTGYSVVLVDLDAMEILPTSQIFPYSMKDAKQKAFDYAKKIIGSTIKKWNLKNIGLQNLASVAKQCNTFDDFKKEYLINIRHGLYWHVTDNPDFKIDPKTGPRDRSSMSDGDSPSVGSLMITSDLAHWAEYYKKDRHYAALIDMSNANLKNYEQVKRGFGNEFFVDEIGTKKAKVVKVVPIKNALAMDKRYDSIKPTSEDALKDFYEFVTKKKVTANSKQINEVLEFFEWHDNYRDLYPGYSDYENEYSDEYFFKSKEDAIREVETILDMFKSISKNSIIKIYRTVYLNKIEDYDSEYGESWAFDKQSALEFGKHANCNYLVVGFTSKNNVDWKESIKRYIIYSFGDISEQENELVIKDTSEIKNQKLISIKDKKEIAVASVKKIIVVDVQPLYEKFIHFDIEKFLKHIKGNQVLYLYNGKTSGLSDDTEQQIEYWLYEKADYTIEDVFTKTKWFDKGYGFLRSWMDLNVDHDAIIKVLQYMMKNNINDSRDIKQLQLVDLIGDEYQDWMKNDCIYFPDLDCDILKSMNNCELIGGGLEECLKEVELLLKACKIKYKINHNFIY